MGGRLALSRYFCASNFSSDFGRHEEQNGRKLAPCTPSKLHRQAIKQTDTSLIMPHPDWRQQESKSASTPPPSSSSSSSFPTSTSHGTTGKASAPGKVILFGDHAVVYGKLAIAAAVSDLRVNVEVVRTHLHRCRKLREGILIMMNTHTQMERQDGRIVLSLPDLNADGSDEEESVFVMDGAAVLQSVRRLSLDPVVTAGAPEGDNRDAPAAISLLGNT